MLFVFFCTDKPDHLAVRQQNRPAHLAYLESYGDRIKAGGPTFADDGTTMNGSLIVVEAASLEDARKLITDDPFAKAGIFASVEIRPWLWSINKPSK